MNDDPIAIAAEPPEVPCCNCCKRGRHTNIATLPRRALEPGKGWGCAICGLPPDGAVAILCDVCIELPGPPRYACAGFLVEEERIAYTDLPPGDFEHDLEVHAADSAPLFCE